jgi:hypothetical protein
MNPSAKKLASWRKKPVHQKADGTPWLKCKGPVGGFQVDSFRAEGYGLLSAVLYLNLLAEHFHATIPKIVIITQ